MTRLDEIRNYENRGRAEVDVKIIEITEAMRLIWYVHMLYVHYGTYTEER